MRTHGIWCLGLVLLTTVTPVARGDSASPARAEVLVIGVYHMANPGQDLFNTQADDVLAPKRQAEIAELIEVLKRFQPTRIALEADYYSKSILRRYDAYKAGDHELTHNERQQIGFRLAKDLGHETVYPVDVDGDFPYMRLADYAKSHELSEQFDALMGEIGKWVEAGAAYRASHTVLETLLHMNSDEEAATGAAFYYRQAQIGNPGNWAGADLVSDWFKRNIRIYSNVAGLVDSPNERVLVIMGAGHLGWLQHSFASNPQLRLRKLAEFAE